MKKTRIAPISSHSVSASVMVKYDMVHVGGAGAGGGDRLVRVELRVCGYAVVHSHKIW